MNYIQKMKEQQLSLTAKVQNFQKAVQSLPEGRIYSTNNGQYHKFYHVIDGKTEYLPKSKDDMINALAKKQYLLSEIKDAKTELKAIDRYMKSHKEDSETQKLLVRYPGIAELLKESLAPQNPKLRRWAEEEYNAYTGHPEALIHPGPFGKMYRSKTEADIAFLLKKNRIPSHYEEIWTINGIEYPIDFTTRHPITGKMIFWEHFGKMDDPLYVKKIGPKLSDFESAGIFPDVNLILTFESGRFPMNSNQLDEIVQQWYF